METMSSMADVGVYTVEDLYAFREQRDDMTVQLLEGELVVAPSPSLNHQVVHSELWQVLVATAPAHLRVVSAPLDLRAGERSVLQPDLMVIDRELRSGREVGTPPTLAVEILSPTSRRTDLVRKPEVLARFGCEEHYWVVDPLNPALRVFRLVGEAHESALVVEGEELFETDVPFPVRFRPADLVR